VASQYPTNLTASDRQTKPRSSDASRSLTAIREGVSTHSQAAVATAFDGTCVSVRAATGGATDETQDREAVEGGCQSQESRQGWAWNFDPARPCDECGGTDYMRSSSGEWYCETCGAVHTRGDVEQQDPGWVNEEDRRSGPSTGPAELQVGSSVGVPWHDEGGRWAQYNERLSYRNKRLLDSLKEIRALTTTLELTESTRDEAAVLFRKAASDGLLQGRSLEGIAAASVYIAARRNEEPVTFQWIADVSPVEKSEITGSYRKLLSAFDLEMRVPVPVEFIDRIGSDVGLGISVRNRAREMLNAVRAADAHVGQSPPGMAAAALYGAATEAGKEITQQTIADVAGVSVVTLSRQWQTIKDVLDETNDDAGITRRQQA